MHRKADTKSEIPIPSLKMLDTPISNKMNASPIATLIQVNSGCVSETPGMVMLASDIVDVFSLG